MLLRGFCKRILLPLLSLFSLVSPASGSSEDCTGNVLYLEACETAVRDDYCLHMWENCTEITVSGGLYLSFTDIDSLQPLPGWKRSLAISFCSKTRNWRRWQASKI